MTMGSESLHLPERNNSKHDLLRFLADVHTFSSKSKELISDSDEEME